MPGLLFRFEQLEVYQKSLILNKSVYQLTQAWPKEFLFGLTDQLRRACLSISLNIAEGSGRPTRDFQHFLSISRGSCYECVAIIELTKSLNLTTTQEYNILYNELSLIAQMLSKLRTSIGRFTSRSNQVTK
jgi:four helix bundle protein